MKKWNTGDNPNEEFLTLFAILDSLEIDNAVQNLIAGDYKFIHIFINIKTGRKGFN